MSKMKLTPQNWRLFSKNVKTLFIDWILSAGLPADRSVPVCDPYSGEPWYYITRMENHFIYVHTDALPKEEIELDVMDLSVYELECLCEALC